MPFDIGCLPPELLIKVLKSLPLPTLATVCRLSKAFSSEAVPILWRSINFQALRDHDLLDRMRDFLMTCLHLQKDRPERWNKLAGYVTSLKLVRTRGVGIPIDDPNGNEFSWSMMDAKDCFLDVIADLSRLECLHFYAKSSLDDGFTPKKSIEHMQNALPELKELAIGGNIDKRMVNSLFSYPEKLERLTIMNIQDGRAGQEQFSGGLLFLEPLAPRFSHLTYLHLSKLAELSEDHWGVMHCRFGFDHDNDRAILKEWANLLPHVSNNLSELILEDCYLISGGEAGNVRRILDGDDEANSNQDWGKGSMERFAQVVMPVLAVQSWPQLKRLSLVGVATLDLEGNPGKCRRQMIDNLPSHVQLYIRPGSLAPFNDDATPIDISPPESPFGL